ncbi:battenin isoform X1 [Leptopilina heterotoma]|uniref:battenin isoform X1 n=1 Tax=Leptopilina heterotoma TaxID=63436 RepID=UPI001CA86667|nr:battenin isoform X1 [Leptopilina heterotoma]XP_043471456.1 battenin isoform X1 [Leptopilina heterotoma]
MAKGELKLSDIKDVERNDGEKANKIRNLVAFWILGLCNNYGYVVMLSAAHDILRERFDHKNDEPPKNTWDNSTSETYRHCNTISTGAILLADILPCLIVKLIFPFVPYFVNTRVLACILCSIAGFLLVGLGETSIIIILGIVLTSISSGLGELTLIAYCNRFNKHVITCWSSGTGGAGIFGAVSYACLKIWLSTKQTLLLMLIIPFLEGIAFWIILEIPKETVQSDKSGIGSREQIIKVQEKSLKEKLRLVPTLLKYMLPLGLVYLLEYFINQGLFELIEFNNISWLGPSDQYRWLQVDYQIGVFISRSSAVLFTFNKIWIMSVLQFINVIILLFESIYYYMPSFWIVFSIVLWEGLLGGGAYVNTFYKISRQIPAEDRETSFSIVVLADSIGIALAGWMSMPVHNAICQLPRPIRKF